MPKFLLISDNRKFGKGLSTQDCNNVIMYSVTSLNLLKSDTTLEGKGYGAFKLISE